MGVPIFFVPQITWQLAEQIEQRSHTPSQNWTFAVAQQSDLAQQSVQGRAIQGQHGSKVSLGPRQGRGDRSLTLSPAFVQTWQQLQQHALEQDWWQAAQALLER